MRLLAAVVLGACLAGPAAAQQWSSLLKGSPLEVFDSEDNRLLLASALQALERPADQQPLGWSNPKTGHQGHIMVLRAFASKGRECKELQVRTEAQGRKGDDRLYFCRVVGEWKLLGDSQL
jgi:surface antigen